MTNLVRPEGPMHRYVRRSLFAVLIGVVPACVVTVINDPTPDIPVGAVDLSWGASGALRIAQSSYSGYGEPARQLIEDGDTWSAAWAKYNAGVTPQPPLPAVDFTRYDVVLAAMGGRGTGGYSIAVTRVATATDYLYVEVTSTSPGSRCFVTESLTQPVDIVRIPKPHSPLMFVERSVTTNC
jgi:hypothetical protein